MTDGQEPGKLGFQVPDSLEGPELSPTSKEFSESFAKRRKSSQLLSPLRMKPAADGVDAVDGPEDRGEVEEEGVVLFKVFLEEELRRNGIRETATIGGAVNSATIQSRNETLAVNVSQFEFKSPSSSEGSMCSSGSATPSLQKYNHPKWARQGRELRKLADKFATSAERQRVREKATETVQDADITAPMFWDLLAELFFQGQVTPERIVVLFFFCSDVAIFALQRNSIDYFHRFMVWALQYIRRSVCKWVADNGGWEAVLYASVNKVVMAGVVVTTCIFLYFAFKKGKALIGELVKR